ncbi:MAG: Transcriptional regulator [Phycisphaerales bacterium]|nr:Transcriptional regulator [Phycisphaerales bacterium]
MKHTPSAARDAAPLPADDRLGPAAPIVPSLLPPPDAARALSVSERTLFTLTQRGDLPAVRIGRAVRYDPADLRRYVERAKGREVARG